MNFKQSSFETYLKGFNYGSDSLTKPGNVANLGRKKRKKITEEEKETIDRNKKKSEVHKLMMEGVGKPDAKIRFVQRSYESNYEFKNRMHNECQNAITVVNATKTRNVVKEYMRAQKQDKNAVKVDKLNQIEKEKIEEKKTAKLNKKARRLQVLKEQKTSFKLEKKLEEDERLAKKDTVQFGEVVHAPPTFSKLPRGTNQSKTRKISNLLLLDKLRGVKDTDIEDRSKKDLETERLKAIEAYRQLKGRQRL